MAMYGWAVANGIGIAPDNAVSVRWLQQSKHPIARAVCSLMGFRGSDSSEAYRLLSTECDASDPHVQYLLGLCFSCAWGCTKNPAEAMRCFERAGNHICVLFFLAAAFHYGDGVKKDFALALQLYTKSAEQGYAGAQYRLGMIYEKGAGVPEDPQQANHWMQMAADQGYQPAQRRCSKN
eukprot:TRINITY_DN4376_c0_g3_i3.p1 TRINITY_DN4376_c0_g3~~TRINITY_DN4376_c0_g3_i3.p1  ORF type:complete len:202 (-),score=38.47 TRINITY_DN4376_c0_g3_i3:195-731(-)